MTAETGWELFPAKSIIKQTSWTKIFKLFHKETP